MNKLIDQFAKIQNISYQQAEEQIGAATDEEILKNIREITTAKINETIYLNRAQRRTLKKKKQLSNAAATTAAITNKALELDYAHLINQLKELNKKEEMYINENPDEEN